MTSLTRDPRVLELVRLGHALVERDGQRLYAARNSPAIISLRSDGHRLWIKRVGQRLILTLTYPDKSRACIYDNYPDVDGVASITEWFPLMDKFLDELRRRLVLDAMLG